MAYKTDTNGVANTIQTVVHNSLQKPLESASSFLGMGPMIVDSAAPIKFPTLAGAFAVGFVGESEVIPVVDGPTFDDVPLMPSTMKSLKVITKLSEESVRESSIALDSVLGTRLVVDVQRKLDEHFWSANGDGISTPKGVLHPDNVARFNSTGLATTALSLDSLHDAVGIALGEETPMSGLRWVMTPSQLTALRKVKDTSGQYIVSSDVTNGLGFTLLGIPVTVTKRIAAGNTLLLNPSSWAVVRDLSPAVKVLSELYQGTGEIGLKTSTRWDLGVLNGAANTIIKSKP